MLLVQSLLRSAEKRPEHPVIYAGDQTISYGDLIDRVAALASKFKELGVQRGDRVAILLDNTPEFVTSYYAILGIGAVVLPTNTFLVNPELEFIYRHGEVSVLVTSRQFADRMRPVFQNIPSLKNVIQVSPGDATAGGDLEGPVAVCDFATLVRDGNRGFSLDTEAQPSELAVLQYTSGTTGKPKGVMLSHENLITNARAVSRAVEIMDTDRFLLALPVFHSFSQMVSMITPIHTGTSICMVPKIERAELGYSFIHHKPTLFPGVPALYHMLSLAPAPPPEMNPVRLYISGGAPLPRPVQQRFEDNYKKPIYEGYGLTEASPVVSWNLPGRIRVGSVGRPIEGVEVRVEDESGKVLPAGEVGELCVKAGSVMMGYYRSEDETASTIKNGWLRTGDMASIDSDGFISIVERKKELILHKGLNVYPSEVEAVLMRRQEIAEVAVVGIPDRGHGEVPEAVLVFHPDVSVPEHELKALCRENLAAYKVPRKFHVVTQLPKTPTGKIKKADVRVQLESKKRGQ